MDGPTRDPYVGLRPFFEEDSLFFFGRRIHTTAVLEALHESRFLAVVGSSGCGKSSLIRAGVIPALKAGFLVQEQDRWSVVRMRPGTTPLTNLASGICDAVESRGEPDCATALREAVRLEHENAILDFLRRRADGANVLLLVDQFEEVFAAWRDPDAPEADDREGQHRLAKGRAEATDFVDILLRLAAQASLPIYVVLTMRTDYLGDCEVFHGLPEALNRGRYLVPRLTPEQVREAIVGPARLSGATIAPRLLDELLNQLGDRFDQLPVLQHALQRTWAEWDRRGRDGPIDLVHFQAIGGLEEALSRDAENALTGLDLGVAAAVFKRLTATDPEQRRIRSRARLSELAAVSGASKSTVEELIQRFRQDGRNFLFVSADGNPADPVVDISHESLIRQWPRLSAWVDEERDARDEFRELRERARRFERGEAAFLRDPDLSLAAAWQARFKPSDTWAARYGGSLPVVARYITESRSADRRRRRLRNGLALGAAIAAVVITLIIGALRRETLTAQIRADSAEIAGLTAQVDALSTSNADLTAYVGVLTEKNNALRFQSANLDADIDSLTRVIPELRSDIASLEEHLTGLRSDSVSLGVRMAELDAATSRVQGELRELRVVVDDLEREEAEERSTFEHLRDDAVTLGVVADVPGPMVFPPPPPPPAAYDVMAPMVLPRRAIIRMQIVVDSLRFENESLREQIRILLVSNDSISNRIDEQLAEKAELQDTADSLLADRTRLEQEAEYLQQYLSTLRSSIRFAAQELDRDSTELLILRGRELWLNDEIPRLEGLNATLSELLGRDDDASPGHRFASLVVAEREQPIAAGVLATTMFAMAPGTATGPNDPRVVGALRIALTRLGGAATTYTRASPGATAVSVTPGGQTIVMARANGSFDSIPMPVTLTPTANRALTNASEDGATMAVSADGRWIAVAGAGALRLYEGPTRRPYAAQIPSVVSDASSAAFLSDGRLLISGQNGAMTWSIGDPMAVRAGFCTGPVAVVAAAALAPFAACANDDGVVEVWRSDSGQRVASLPHVCSPAESSVVDRDEDCGIQFADLRLSDDGMRAAALDRDGVIRLWAWNESPGSARSIPAALVIAGKPDPALRGPGDPLQTDDVISIAFSPGGERIVALTSSGALAIHVVSPDQLAADICRRLPAGSAPACGARAP